MSNLILYGAPTSSCSFRVRIALALKGLRYEDVCLPTTNARRAEEFTQLNPQRLVPFIVTDIVKLGQSIAIMEYLEETWAGSPLLPTDAAGRARVRAWTTTHGRSTG
ncbi:hypothetical protein WJX81_007209 [Elliptochloris bilobata]|uniref:GST N-terminal domain-containing protein n=1 Tax=Elliptochloris bilobata TaxID=381761 RepID=A0AAW1S7R9_9CHLO